MSKSLASAHDVDDASASFGSLSHAAKAKRLGRTSKSPCLSSFPPSSPTHGLRCSYPSLLLSLHPYHQVDQLSWISQGKSWSFCEVMPDLVVGFVPNNNYYCMAQILATYLALYAKINGKGSEVVFPGTQRSWECLSQDSSQDVIAKTAIYASLHPQETSGQRYNVTDSARPASWSEKWPVICEYFGLRGTGPRDGVAGPVPNEYLVEHYNEWRELEKEEGLKTGRVGNNKSYGDFARVMMTLCDLDRQLDMSKTHAMMGSAKVETDSRGAWWTAFDRFRRAKIIP